MAVSKFMPITYMCTVFVFILGFTLLGEKIYITDILQILMTQIILTQKHLHL